MTARLIICLSIASACTVGDTSFGPTEQELDELCGPFDPGAGFTDWSNMIACRYETTPVDGYEEATEIAVGVISSHSGIEINLEHLDIRFSSRPLERKLSGREKTCFDGMSNGNKIWLYKPRSDTKICDTVLAHELTHTILFHLNGGFTPESSNHTTPLYWDVYLEEAVQAMGCD